MKFFIKFFRFLFKLIWNFFKFLFIFSIIKTSFFELYRIPSSSMEPTLLVGDFIIVNKMAYGFKVPLLELFNKDYYLIKYGEPKRKEVVVFNYPVNPELTYIKRVIGVPHDEVLINKDDVYINKQLQVEPYAVSIKKYFYTETPPVKIPEQNYFMMGDNRDNSVDSRSWGTVKENEIKGRAFVIWFSYDGSKKSLKEKIRFNRIGKLVF